MKKYVNISLFLLTFLVKFIISLILISWDVSLLYSLSFALIYMYLIFKKSNEFKYIPFVMIDFIISFIVCFKVYGLNLVCIATSIIYFGVSSMFAYILIINILSNQTKDKGLYRLSNLEVDYGIRALENKDYDVAIESFLKAIKSYKKNYLGYMGMCTTLSKMDKKNLRKIKYYKKKYLKYAPRELKESIKDN